MTTIEQLMYILETAIEEGIDPNTPVRIINDIFTSEGVSDLAVVEFQNRKGQLVRKVSNTHEVLLIGAEGYDNE